MNITNYLTLAILTAFSGCRSDRREEVKILHEGRFIVKATFADGKRNGKTEIYDSSGKLTATANYKDNLQFGNCIHYFPDGAVADSVMYLLNKPHGYWRMYNHDGSLKHVGYYYFGLQFGPDLIYRDSTILKDFEFLNFERRPIVECTYNSHGNLDSIRKMELQVELGEYEGSNKNHLKFFAYLPKIPLVAQTYSIGLIDKNKNIRRLSDIKGGDFFIDTLLSAPPQGYHYYLECVLVSNDTRYNDTLRVEAKNKE